MGKFVIDLCDGNPLIELPNILHDAGANFIIGAMFGQGGLPRLKMGLTCHGGKELLPNVSTQSELPRDTSFNAIDSDENKNPADRGFSAGGDWVNKKQFDDPPPEIHDANKFRDRWRFLMTFINPELAKAAGGTSRDRVPPIPGAPEFTLKASPVNMVSRPWGNDPFRVNILTTIVEFKNQGGPWLPTADHWYDGRSELEPECNYDNKTKDWYYGGVGQGDRLFEEFTDQRNSRSWVPWQNNGRGFYPWDSPRVSPIVGPGERVGLNRGRINHRCSPCFISPPPNTSSFSGEWRLSGCSPEQFSDSAAENLHRLSSMPLSTVYIRQSGGSKNPLISAVFPTGVRVRPDQRIKVYWTGSISAGRIYDFTGS